MVTLEAHCRSGHYLAAIVPMMDSHFQTKYYVVVYQHGQEIYEEGQDCLEDAIRTASDFLDHRKQREEEMYS